MTGVVIEDDIQGFLDSFTFQEEFEWCINEYEEQRQAYEEVRYEKIKL